MADEPSAKKAKVDEGPAEPAPVPEELKTRVKTGKEEIAVMELHLLNKHNALPERTVSILGKDFILHPKVFGADIFGTSGPCVKCCIETGLFGKDKSFLDMGTGCGVISIFAVLHGCSEVTGVDIDAAAVANAKVNAEKHNAKVTFLESDLFAAVSGQKFDSIFWNYPGGSVFEGGITDIHSNEGIVSDGEHKLLRRFLNGVKNYLKPGGRVITGYEPEFGEPEIFQNILDEAGLCAKRIFRTMDTNEVGEFPINFYEYGTLQPAGGPVA
jgi:release factor glutamine methyltransferase